MINVSTFFKWLVHTLLNNVHQLHEEGETITMKENNGEENGNDLFRGRSASSTRNNSETPQNAMADCVPPEIQAKGFLKTCHTTYAYHQCLIFFSQDLGGEKLLRNAIQVQGN
jgi:hypothetical protein